MKKTKPSLYDFIVRDNQGKEVPLRDYQGKILLIVNTAIHCSFTSTYRDLEETYRRYHRFGFEILDFPCNQFHGQAPESDDEIDRFCRENYDTTFKRFQKVEVNGPNADPLFLYLQNKKKFIGFDKGHPLAPVIASIHIKEGPFWEENPSIKWNFTKFLIDRSGKVVKRFECTSKESDVNKAVERVMDRQLENPS